MNNEGTAPITATITLTATTSGANEFVLTAPSLSSKAVTIGGSAVIVDEVMQRELGQLRDNELKTLRRLLRRIVDSPERSR